MPKTSLEHINYSVKDAKVTAAHLCDLFGWKIRWEGSAMNGAGYTCHVGDDTSYLAVYSPNGATFSAAPTVLNHVGVVVDDLDAMEKRVIEAGYKPHLHADYEPGKRFYFDGPDGIEFEIVCYD